MEKLFSSLKKLGLVWTLFAFGLFIVVFITYVTGPQQIDTLDYVSQINHFRNPADSQLEGLAALKIFKPLYASVGYYLSFLSPETVILLLNAIFFVGTYILFGLFLQALNFSFRESIYGALLAILLYPALWYGYALGTDVSGWFFCVASMYLAYLGIKSQKLRLIILASLLGFIGFLGKETGVLGLGFAGLLILFRWPDHGFKTTFKMLLVLCAPFFILEIIYLGLLHAFGTTSFLDWFSKNDSNYGNVHTLKFFLGSEISTFNILLVYACIGLYGTLKKKIVVSKETVLAILALIVTSLPILVWPIFLDRVLYIQFIAIIPLALLGIRRLFDLLNTLRVFHGSVLFKCIIILLPIIMSIFMMYLGGQDGLYEFVEELSEIF